MALQSERSLDQTDWKILRELQAEQAEQAQNLVDTRARGDRAVPDRPEAHSQLT
ncbi:MAG TPA: hypothetical protein VFN02_01540 [Ktedonobacteraceae bacterium]|nr:hypothetical protein [Ktedonobacteraceae bacterium]